MEDGKITVDRLQEAGGVLNAIGEAFRNIRMFDEEHEKNRMEIMLMLSSINMVVTELALFLSEGNEIHDALRAVVRGERQLDADSSDMFQRAMGDMKNPMKKN